MTAFPTFEKQDFEVFTLPGLALRMEQIRSKISPKLEVIGNELAPFLSKVTGEEAYSFVAKHARRSVNPPDDTWVAWSGNVRGYKSHPHFEVGLWATHLFVWFALFAEAGAYKPVFARKFQQHLPEIQEQIPSHFVWSQDHTQPQATTHQDMQRADFLSLAERLETVKKSEVLCGIHLKKGDPTLGNSEQLRTVIQDTLKQLVPLYRLAFDR